MPDNTKTYQTDTDQRHFPAVQQVDGRIWRFIRQFTATTDWGILLIKTGFAMDFGSIPRLAWPVVGCPHGGRGTAGYAVHDALYAAQITTRAEADKILLELLAAYDVGYFKRHTIYRMVRLFGGAAWKSKSDYEETQARSYVMWTGA
jgi:hypothetical protein